MKYPYNKKVLLAGICIGGIFIVIGTTTGDINPIRMILIAAGLTLLFCSIKYQNSRRFGAGLLTSVGAFCCFVGIVGGIRGILSLFTGYQKMEWVEHLVMTILFLTAGCFSFKTATAMRKSGGETVEPRLERSGFEKETEPASSGKAEDTAVCAECKYSVMWDEAYKQDDTPGSVDWNPPGYGEFRPRVFCPHCGCLIAEWDLDPSGDRDRWTWYKENGTVNTGNKLPPNPALLWGKSIPRNARKSIEHSSIDISEIQIEKKDAKVQAGEKQENATEKEDMPESSNFDKLFGDLENEDPDVRRETSRLLSKGSENLKMLISIYQNCLDSDPKRASLAGRVLGRMIAKDSDDDVMVEIAQAMLGITVSFIACPCVHCGHLNRGIPAPPNAPMVAYYHQTDDQGAYAISVLCDNCGKDFFVVWDDDPR